jgi:putative membrane protein
MSKASILSALTGAAGAVLPFFAWARGPSETYKYDWGPHHLMWWAGGWFGMFLGPLVMILVLVLLVVAVVLILRGGVGPWHGPTPPPRKALDILKERFARGEIEKEEFEERRRLLGD